MSNKNENGVTEDAVMQALSTVIEPELHRDLVSLNMIRNLQIEGNDVTFTIMLTTPACPLKGKMEQDSRAALSQIEGLGNVTIKWDANVPVQCPHWRADRAGISQYDCRFQRQGWRG
jgi:ATP-binding protein involved in chromosome partitioning